MKAGNLKVVVLFIILVALTLGCAQNSGKSGKSEIPVSPSVKLNASYILKKMNEKCDSLRSYSMTVIRKVGRDENSTKVYQLYYYVFEKPNKTYLRDIKNGVLMVSNGKTIWVYNRQHNEVKVLDVNALTRGAREEYEMGLLKAFVNTFSRNYNSTYAGVVKENGRSFYLLNLKPHKRFTGGGNVSVYVSPDTWLPEKIVYRGYTMFGPIVTVTLIENVTLNPKVNESMFTFTVPSGAKVIYGTRSYTNVSEAQKHVNFTILVPKYAAGMKLDKILVSPENTVTLFYRNDSNSFIVLETPGNMTFRPLAERVKINGVTVQKGKTISGGHYFEFAKNGVTIYILSDNLNTSVLFEITRSMLE